MSARDDLVTRFGADVELVKSGGGVFEVTMGDDLLFSKKSLGRFPEQGELESLVTSRGDPGPASASRRSGRGEPAGGGGPAAGAGCCLPTASCEEDCPT